VNLAVFDLDGTLTWRDCFGPYVLGYLRRHPRRILRLWPLPCAALRYFFDGFDRGRLKESVIRAALGGASRRHIEDWTSSYVERLRARGGFRPAALKQLERHRADGEYLILLSASPSLYVPRIAAALEFSRCICTEVRWHGETLDGRLQGANRRAEEKSRCIEALRREFPVSKITAYGNSSTDVAHLRAADSGYLVNGNARARSAAARAGLRILDWGSNK
jgi:phosphatidylglycerophosphatase C